MRHTSGLVLGYHGCEKTVGEKVISSGRGLEFSRNLYDWLGHGIYFWENDIDRALEFASRKQDPKIKEPYVVGAVIDLAFCLDLVNVECLELVRESHKFLCDVYEVAGYSDKMPRNEPGSSGDDDLKKRNLDCAVIEALHMWREVREEEPFKTVRSPFSEGNPLYEGGKIMERTHIQICVRDPSCILGYFKPIL